MQLQHAQAEPEQASANLAKARMSGSSPWSPRRPSTPRAIQAAREALDLAAHPECQYAWGEADAAQAWARPYFANHEPTLAKRAFTRALEVRKRIEHPGVTETEKWLARVG